MSHPSASRTRAVAEPGAVAPTTDPSPGARLLRLARILDQAASDADSWPRPPLLVRVIERADHNPELGVRSLEDDHPLVALTGFRAPADWSAIGTIVGGRVHHLDPVDERRRSSSPPHARPDARGEPPRARVVHLVHRSGHAVSIVRHDQGEVLVDQSAPLAASRGRIDDACRRALDLATSPPTDEPLALWASLWLDRVMVATLAGERATPRSWADLAALHPASTALASRRASPRLDAPDIAAATVSLGRAWGWEELRVACAGNRWRVEGIEPEWAAWMDAGMFSRWVRQQLPDMAQVVDCLAAHLPEQLVTEMVSMLESWGLVRSAAAP